MQFIEFNKLFFRYIVSCSATVGFFGSMHGVFPSKVEFVDFVCDRDSQLIENIFAYQQNYVQLNDDHKTDPWVQGKGMIMFNTCSSIGAEELGGGGKILRIVCEDAEPISIGFGTYFFAKDNKHNYAMNMGDACLPLLALDKDHQGKGYGLILMQEIFSLIKHGTSQKVWLKVHKDNKIAINLYEKLGFNFSGICPLHQPNEVEWMFALLLFSGQCMFDMIPKNQFLDTHFSFK